YRAETAWALPVTFAILQDGSVRLDASLPRLFFFSSRRRHTRWPRDWSSDVCSSDLSSTLSPFDNASVMLSKTVLTIVSVSFLVRFAIFETSSIRSALVIVRSRPDWRKTFAWNYLAT